MRAALGTADAAEPEIVGPATDPATQVTTHEYYVVVEMQERMLADEWLRGNNVGVWLQRSFSNFLQVRPPRSCLRRSRGAARPRHQPCLRRGRVCGRAASMQRVIKHPLTLSLDRPRLTTLFAVIRNKYPNVFYSPLLKIVSENDNVAAGALARWTLMGELFRPDEVAHFARSPHLAAWCRCHALHCTWS